MKHDLSQNEGLRSSVDGAGFRRRGSCGESSLNVKEHVVQMSVLRFCSVLDLVMPSSSVVEDNRLHVTGRGLGIRRYHVQVFLLSGEGCFGVRLVLHRVVMLNVKQVNGTARVRGPEKVSGELESVFVMLVLGHWVVWDVSCEEVVEDEFFSDFVAYVAMNDLLDLLRVAVSFEGLAYSLLMLCCCERIDGRYVRSKLGGSFEEEVGIERFDW